MEFKKIRATTPCIAHCGWIPNRNSLQFTIFRLRRKIIADFPQRAIHKHVVKHLKRARLKINDMIIYCLIYPILTMTFFMIWISNSTLAGGEIGMTPLLVGIVLLIVFGIEMLLTLIFKKRLTRTRNKIIALGIAFLLYELTMWFMSGSFVLLESFQKPFSENISGAYSFSSIISLTIILILILIKAHWKIKKTFYNTVYSSLRLNS